MRNWVWFAVVFALFVSTPTTAQEVPPDNTGAVCQECALGDIPLDDETYQSYLLEYELDAVLPSSYDARNDGIVTSPKNQGSCGSCWAFASVGAMESHILKGGGPAYDLSEQQQNSCNTSMYGCCGGSSSAPQFWQTQGPIQESCGPYGDGGTGCPTYSNVPCSSMSGCAQLDYRVVNWHTVTQTTEGFKNSLYTYGPSYWRWTVYSDFNSFWSTAASGAVYTNGPGTSQLGGHAVLLIGWSDAKQAFLLKNSWGATGGPQGDGTFWMAYSGHYYNQSFAMSNFELTGGSQNPSVDIKANGSDGPITVGVGTPIKLDIDINAGDRAGDPVEIWVVINTPFGYYYYSYPAGVWKSGLKPTYTGPLPSAAATVLNQPVPQGSYTGYLGLDFNVNGVPDAVPYLDQVDFNVSNVMCPSIVGAWSKTYNWDAGTTPMNFHPDGTWDSGEGYTGTWTQNGCDVDFVYDVYLTHYWGTMDPGGDYMAGDMATTSGQTGDWNATRVAAPSIVGTWSLTYMWDMGTSPITFNPDGTFTVEGYTGTWTQNGYDVDWVFTSGTHYWGTLDPGGDYMAGEMLDPTGHPGDWYATRGSAPSIVGTWSLTYLWDMGVTDITFNPDGTFTTGEGGDGTWTQSGYAIDWVFTNGTHYWGTLDPGGDYMSGEMLGYTGITGNWTASRGSTCPSIVGTWTLTYLWDMGVTTNTFYPDGTFTTGEGSEGTWTQSGCGVDWVFTNTTHYWGTMDPGGTYMEGEMLGYTGSTGSWSAVR